MKLMDRSGIRGKVHGNFHVPLHALCMKVHGKGISTFASTFTGVEHEVLRKCPCTFSLDFTYVKKKKFHIN